MLIPNVDMKEFEKFGFKPCRGLPKGLQCYYLCVARGCKLDVLHNTSLSLRTIIMV